MKFVIINLDAFKIFFLELQLSLFLKTVVFFNSSILFLFKFLFFQISLLNFLSIHRMELKAIYGSQSHNHYNDNCKLKKKLF